MVMITFVRIVIVRIEISSCRNSSFQNSGCLLYPSGIVYLGHLYAGESGQFRPIIFWVRCGVSSERKKTIFHLHCTPVSAVDSKQNRTFADFVTTSACTNQNIYRADHTMKVNSRQKNKKKIRILSTAQEQLNMTNSQQRRRNRTHLTSSTVLGKP